MNDKIAPDRNKLRRLERRRQAIRRVQWAIYVVGAIVFCTIIFFEAGLAIIAYGSRLSVLKNELAVEINALKKKLRPKEQAIRRFQKIAADIQKAIQTLAQQRLALTTQYLSVRRSRGAGIQPAPAA